MKIQHLQLRHVRRIRELTLDLTHPITLIAGPNGSGKTTLQKAIQAALFFCDKKDRDALQSEFDRDSPPEAVLHLTFAGNGSAAVLTRFLMDDRGSWQEGGVLVQKKREALNKIADLLAIPVEAAGALLWGNQDDQGAVIGAFPGSGLSFLTDAVIRGGGPDPNELSKQLDKDMESAEKGSRGGKDVGRFIQARKDVEKLSAELAEATTAELQIGALKEMLQMAQTAQSDSRRLCEELKTAGQNLKMLRAKLATALDAQAAYEKLKGQQSVFDGLDETIRKCETDLIPMREKVARLQSQARLALDREQAQRIESLTRQIRNIDAAAADLAELEKVLHARKRPKAAEVIAVNRAVGDIKKSQTQLESAGVRYRLEVADLPRIVQITEENNPPRTVELVPGTPIESIVGRVEIVSGDLRFTAAGKSDVAEVKYALVRNQQELERLLEPFGVADETGFQGLLDETQQLKDAITAARNQQTTEAKGDTLDGLKSKRSAAEAERQMNGSTVADHDAWRGQILPASSLVQDLARLQGAVQAAENTLAELKAGRPTPELLTQLRQELVEARRHAQETASAFTVADDKRHHIRTDSLQSIELDLESKRAEYNTVNQARHTAELKAMEATTQLKSAGPKRSVVFVEEELQLAQARFKRQEVEQNARCLLRDRISTKITELTQSVPADLAKNVGAHLREMTGGFLDAVALDSKLNVSEVREPGANPYHWSRDNLSCGERLQTALAIKIALARALADATGSMFLILDDYLVHFDPSRRSAAEELLLDLVSDGRLQVIFLTCHTDWAAEWARRCPERISYVNLPEIAAYYRPLRRNPAMKNEERRIEN